MAQKVTEFEFRSTIGRKGSKYPWDKWLDGDVWELKKGDDFTVDQSHFRQTAYAAAKARGKKIITESHGDVLYLQAHTPED